MASSEQDVSLWSRSAAFFASSSSLSSRIIHAPLLARLKISGNLTVCGCQL